MMEATVINKQPIELNREYELAVNTLVCHKLRKARKTVEVEARQELMDEKRVQSIASAQRRVNHLKNELRDAMFDLDAALDNV